jgi:uncharacterized membrane protein YjjP (DUF1212 family)
MDDQYIQRLQKTMEKDVHNQLKDVSKFLSDYATSLMSVGVQTSRIVRNTERIAEAYGCKCETTIFQKTVIMTLWDAGYEHSYSSVGRMKSLGLNFKMNAELSRLSWDIVDKTLPLSVAKVNYESIIQQPRESKWLVLILVSLANAAFCKLFQGDAWSMLVVFFATLFGFFLKQLLLERRWNELAVYIISAFVAAIFGCSAYVFHLGNTPEVALGTSVLYLIPGVPLINGIMDIIDSHVLAGISRLINAALLIICLAVGLSAAILLIGVQTL